MVEDRRVAGGGDRIQGLNRPILQSGHARLDALILRERGHMNLVEGFKELQGFTPDQIENIASRNLTFTLKVADAVGGYHFSGHHLEQEETRFFERIKDLVMQEKYEEAEKASKGLLSTWGLIC